MKIWNRIARAIPLLLPLGCATVDAEQDYERAGRLIGAATGVESVYRPGDDDEIRERVAELLGSGLELREAVEIALLNNPELQRSFYAIGVSRADLVQAGLLPNPTLGFALRFPLSGGLTEIESELGQEIADLWRIAPEMRAAEEELAASILAVAREATALSTHTRIAYFRTQAARELLAIAGENLEVAQSLLLVSRAREEAGAGTQLEVNVAFSEMGSVRLDQLDAELELRAALMELSSALGLEVTLRESELVTALSEPPRWSADEEALVAVAMQQRLDLKAAERALGAAEARLEIELRGRFPSVELGLTYERADGASALGPTAGIELPIFDQNQAQIAKARFLLSAARKNLDALRLAVRREVLDTYRRGRIEWETAAFFAAELLPHSEQNMGLSLEAYGEDKISFLSALTAQQRFLEARSEYVARKLRSAVVRPELEQALGIPLDAAREQMTRPSVEQEPIDERGKGYEN